MPSSPGDRRGLRAVARRDGDDLDARAGLHRRDHALLREVGDPQDPEAEHPAQITVPSGMTPFFVTTTIPSRMK